MRKFINATLTAAIIVSSFIFAKGQDKHLSPEIYAASTLPDSLKKNAHGVYRYEEIKFDIDKPDKATEEVHTVITLLDEHAQGYKNFVIGYDQFSKISDVIFKIYNKDGELVQKYKRKDMDDHAYLDDENLLTDERILSLQMAIPSYPCTIEKEYKISYSSLINYEDWVTAYNGYAYQYGKLVISAPKDMDIRYKLRNFNKKPFISYVKNNKIYTWEAANMPAIPEEAGTENFAYHCPGVWVAPVKFEYDHVAGSMDSWKDFGSWAYPFYTDELNDKQKEKIRKLVSGVSSDKEKIKILYHYLQQNMRYVSIQLGIGGYKPFPASFVFDKKYGDCKALSNFMRAMLEAVNIKAYPALINAGANAEPVSADFPINHFNHVILCVPQRQDTIWLECTSNITSPGVLGSFTENRNALLLTPEGGVLVKTPVSRPEENIFCSNALINMGEEGDGKANVNLSGTGNFREMFYALTQENNDDQQKLMIRKFAYKQPDNFIAKKKIGAPPDDMCTDVKMNFEKIPDFSAGNKMFLSARLYHLINGRMPSDTARKYDYYFEYPYIKYDTTQYILPAGYTTEHLPDTLLLDNKYGSYASQFSYNKEKNTITSTAKLELKQHHIPAADYKVIYNFFNTITKSDREKIIINKP